MRKSTCHAVLSCLLCAIISASCATEPRIPYAEADQIAAMPKSARNIRFWADAPTSVFSDTGRGNLVSKGQPFSYLALSGGGGAGAYGAGVLNGWSEAGTRPAFTLVSGVSIGALIAPFAFLGSAYDDKLRDLYTNGEAERLIRNPDVLGVIFGAGLFGRPRLRQLVERYLDDALLKAVAEEDRKGRRLLVVTTDIDAQRAVIWDMGAIAVSGAPNAYALFRDVLAASASIPVVFEPQLINIVAGDRKLQEMHLDGTVSAPVFTLPDTVLFGGKTIAAQRGRSELYVIVNARIEPDFEVVPNKSDAIAVRSFSTMNLVGIQAVLAQTYTSARRQGMRFSLSYIGKDFVEADGTGFETAAMQRLYSHGYEKARSGSFWMRTLPQIDAARRTNAPRER